MNDLPEKLTKLSIMQKIQQAEALRETLRPQYAEAVAKLTRLALGDTGGSIGAAALLLSLNGQEKTSLVELCRLDMDYFEFGVIAIRGRYYCGEYPENMIEHGPDIFREIQKLHTADNR